MTIVPTVDARWAGLAADRLKDEDPEFQAVLYEAGLRLADVDDPDARIPFHMHAALLEIAARRLGDPLFGLRLGATIHPKRAGLLGTALLGASTVEDALLSLERYLRVTGEGVQLDVEIKRKHTILTVTIDDPRVAAKRQAVEFAMILLVSLCRSLTDTLVEPVRIEFEHAPPEKIGVFNRTFGAPVRFEAPRNAIVLNTDDLDLPVRTVETPLSRRLEGHRREVLDSPPRVKGLPRRVREQIARLLSTSDSSIEAVAREPRHQRPYPGTAAEGRWSDLQAGYRRLPPGSRLALHGGRNADPAADRLPARLLGNGLVHARLPALDRHHPRPLPREQGLYRPDRGDARKATRTEVRARRPEGGATTMSKQRQPVLTGGCQCGAVRYTLYAEPEHASVCHCRMCQKAMGNAFAPFAAVRLDDFRWTRGSRRSTAAPPSSNAGSAATAARRCRSATPTATGSTSPSAASTTPTASPQPNTSAPRAGLPWLHLADGLPKSRTETSMKPDRAAKMQSFQHPDHDTPDDWTAKGATGRLSRRLGAPCPNSPTVSAATGVSVRLRTAVPIATVRRLGYLNKSGIIGHLAGGSQAERLGARRPNSRMEEMSNTYTAIFERDGEWTIAYCPEIPGANGQGRTKQEARDSLAAAIALILEDRREQRVAEQRK